MSFGFGVGDFLAVFELATKVRSRWIDAPVEYTSIKNETKNLDNILRNIGEFGTIIDLDEEHEDTLIQACRSCRKLLQECGELAEGYSFPYGAPHRFPLRHVWTATKPDPDKIFRLCGRLSAQVTQLKSLQDAIDTDIVAGLRGAALDLPVRHARHELETITNWFSSSDHADRQVDRLADREPGTATWFLAHREYQHWRCHLNSTLICPGIPGSGKTVIVATIINDLKTYFAGDKDIAIAYFYCSFNRQTDQTLERMLAVLVRQLFQERAILPESITALYQKHHTRAVRPLVDELKEMLRTLSNSYARVFFVIDALDECGPECNHLLDELTFIQNQKSACVNILATTRVVPDILQRFSAHPQIEILADIDDIRHSLNRRMSRHPRFVTQDVKLQEEIIQKITSADHGMFLLARLQLDLLCDNTNRRQMRHVLTQLEPSSNALGCVYENFVKRIELQPNNLRVLARKVLLWIIYAKRELSIDELREAIAVEPGQTNLDMQDDLDDVGQIVSVCHGLVLIDQKSRAIHLVHRTAHEYFEKIRDQWLPDGNLEITRSCLAYLRLDEFRHSRYAWLMDVFETIKTFKFLEYAVENWGLHARLVDNEALEADIVEFLLFVPDHLRLMALVRLTRLYPLAQSTVLFKWRIAESSVHVSVLFRLGNVLQRLLLRGQDVNNADDEGRTPLSFAAEDGYIEGVRLLLAQHDIDPNYKDNQGISPLSWAAMNGHIEIVQQLLARPDIEADSKDKDNVTPLSWAADEGHTAAVQLLLTRSDVEADSKDEEGTTPLSAAAMRGHLEVVKLLLARTDVTANSKDKYGRTPLSWAAEKGQKEVVQLLLTRPDVDADSKDQGYRSSLSYAAENGHVEVVQVLFARPEPGWDSKDIDGRTPFFHAAAYGHTKVVQLLLTRPNIIVDLKDKDNRTPLSYAAEDGHSEIVQLLLTRPEVEADSKDDKGRTPLSLAVEKGHIEVIQLLKDHLHLKT